MEEKNKYVKLKQISSQTITELMEQVKILENETEIQRSIVINKDRCVHVCCMTCWYNEIIYSNAEKEPYTSIE